MPAMEYSIVIPAFNESDKITSTLTKVLGFMRTFSDDFEVIVVDDGSKDNTADLVEEYAKSNPEVKIIRNPHKGKGPTVWKGVMEARGDLINLCDADLATPIEELKRLSMWTKEHDFDVVIASREDSGAERVNEPLYRHLMGRVFNFWVRVMALPGIKDSQCGFKLFTNKAAKDIFKRLAIYGEDAKELEGAYLGAFDVEVLYLAKKLGYKIKSLPVTWTYVKTTRLNPVFSSYNMARDVFKVRLNDMRGAYKKDAGASAQEIHQVF